MSVVLLKWANELTRTPLDATRGRWPRVAAVLGRQALEDALLRLWAGSAPGVEDSSMRAQLLCLGSYTDGDLADRISYAYGGLTRACHHHSYELSPTAEEIIGWLNDVAALTNMLDAAGAK